MEWVAAAIGVGKAVAGIFGAKKQEKLEKERAQLGYEDNLEKIRRREFQQQTTQGAAQAFSQNAGVLHSGGSTAQGFLDTMSSEFKKELDWMKKYAKRAHDLGVKSAGVNFSTNVMNSITGGIQTGSNIYGMIK